MSCPSEWSGAEGARAADDGTNQGGGCRQQRVKATTKGLRAKREKAETETDSTSRGCLKLPSCAIICNKTKHC